MASLIRRRRLSWSQLLVQVQGDPGRQPGQEIGGGRVGVEVAVQARQHLVQRLPRVLKAAQEPLEERRVLVGREAPVRARRGVLRVQSRQVRQQVRRRVAQAEQAGRRCRLGPSLDVRQHHLERVVAGIASPRPGRRGTPASPRAARPAGAAASASGRPRPVRPGRPGRRRPDPAASAGRRTSSGPSSGSSRPPGSGRTGAPAAGGRPRTGATTRECGRVLDVVPDRAAASGGSSAACFSARSTSSGISDRTATATGRAGSSAADRAVALAEVFRAIGFSVAREPGSVPAPPSRARRR